MAAILEQWHHLNPSFDTSEILLLYASDSTGRGIITYLFRGELEGYAVSSIPVCRPTDRVRIKPEVVVDPSTATGHVWLPENT